MTVGPMPSEFVDPDELRAEFCSALSKMYRSEVPLYGDLVELVDEINDRADEQESWQISDRLKVERHGAIRLGLPSELHTISRLFRLMGMYPVGYYDLSGCGVPVHATAFRPTTRSSLSKNPFRVFTSLLRPELIPDAKLRDQVLSILSKRDIFHPTTRALISQAETRGGLTRPETNLLVQHALETFKWHEEALVPAETYARMRAVHPLLADIAGFRGPHINHLTPRVLDIDAAQAGMPARGICPKAIIEGPPRRLCPILLRQTSFQALTEHIRFPGGGSEGSHRARFGEIESRGCALTKKGNLICLHPSNPLHSVPLVANQHVGHDLYLSLMAESQRTAPPNESNAAHQTLLHQIFTHRFPDTWTSLRQEGLAFFRYTLITPPQPLSNNTTLDELIDSGNIQAEPIVYEDFLPASAAGIFRSNLGQEQSEHVQKNIEAEEESTRKQFEIALGRPVEDFCDLYQAMESDSLQAVERTLGYRLR
ncbi:hypothetical protein BCR39DRAFT_183887 [Naematelia encephala]|uniref:2-oxoadipate dioxygenase/decarboxylase n=1 Tax=Naematelia encephala TaxID=71784 RepID=A0A1Y2B376_9TREE|nr:hypothetical protein BCR39DRAFT_183887 [Naematelia encephala]